MSIYQSEKLAILATQVMKEHSKEFKELLEGEYSIVFLESNQTKKDKGRVVHADCALIADNYKWCCPYDFKITFYNPNIEGMDEILMWHELKHCGTDKDKPYIKDHDYYYADFKEIVDTYGTNWSTPKVQGE